MRVIEIQTVMSAFETTPKGLLKWQGDFKSLRTIWDYPIYSIIRIGQNTEKNPEDLRRLAFTQTPVENYQLMLIGKTAKEVKWLYEWIKFIEIRLD